MPLPVEEQRLALIRNLHKAFDLTEGEASALAAALRRDGPLVGPMHREIMVGPLKGRHELLADELRDWLTHQGVDTRWVTLVSAKIRPKWKYIYYVLRDGAAYGGFALSEHPL